MDQRDALVALATGRVQGVFFRDFVRRHAVSLGLKGYVRNMPDGSSVEVKAQGEEVALTELVRLLWQGPLGARVDSVVTRRENSGAFLDFQIR